MASIQRGKEEGDVFVSTAGAYYVKPEISADILYDFRQNVYGKGLERKQRNLIFTEKFLIEVTDKNGEADEELQLTLTQMCEEVRMWANMIKAYTDIFWFGGVIFNPVWGFRGNEYRLLKLRHLPAHSFATAPTATTRIYAQILQGIIFDREKGEIQFWQLQDNTINPIQIKNVFHVKDPASFDLAGDSIVAPLVPIFEMLKFVWNAQMQQANRTGAKILFIKITKPQPATLQNSNVGDVDYASKLLQNWTKDTAFLLRENMELVDPGIRDDANNLEVIDALHKLVIDYITSTGFIAREGTMIGGSETERAELLYAYIRGIHTWLEDAFEEPLRQYLEYNHYVGYTVNIHIPSPSPDRSEIALRQAETGFKTRSLMPNEIRERLGAEQLDEEGVEGLITLYERFAPSMGMKETLVIKDKSAIIPKETPARVREETKDELEEVGERFAARVIEILEENEEE